MLQRHAPHQRGQPHPTVKRASLPAPNAPLQRYAPGLEVQAHACEECRAPAAHAPKRSAYAAHAIVGGRRAARSPIMGTAMQVAGLDRDD